MDTSARDRVRMILDGRPADRCGFWLGNPWEETKQLYCKGLDLDYVPPVEITPGKWAEAHEAVLQKGKADADLACALSSDLYWCSPELDPLAWQHPEGKPIFDCHGGKSRVTLGQPGVFADCEDVKEVEDFDWPDPDHLDFTSTLELIDHVHSRGMAVAGGMWIPFFHVLCDFMGMEQYFIKMYTHPEVVEAITEKVLAFYLEANQRFLNAAPDRLDLFFFGNDLGSQQDLLISPEAFDRFVYPGICKVVDQVQGQGLKVMLHSCGAVSKIIPRLVEKGVDALHPLQARARGMDAESLAQYKKDLVFVGGVDTQDLLPFRSPQEIRDEVERIKGVFGPRWIVSPSHEALLPNVSLENVLAMRDAALA